ncbi:hypothetical protein KR018_001498, partial [Drosophila ironensis]
LRSKLTNLFTNSLTFASQVIVFTETWLKSDILNSEIFPNKYSIFRRDRPHRRGGGVLIAIDSKLV